ncbi:uncharacterized conserved protein [Vibrio ponticus]|nr:uncharacterized conserved protein [Vibrio ponticus]
MNNLFSHIPPFLENELFSDIVTSEQVRIERIVSYGQSSPEKGWYDQDEHEWVMVLTGFGIVEYDTGEIFALKQGDYLAIPAQQKHRVKATSEKEPTVWLAVFYPA